MLEGERWKVTSSIGSYWGWSYKFQVEGYIVNDSFEIVYVIKTYYLARVIG